MARVLNKFSSKTSPYVKANTVNHEGFPSFIRSLEEGYLQVLLTNTLGGTFYASENELLKESLDLHAEMAEKDPQFMARAIVYARNEGFMRLQPIVGLSFLAKADRGLFRAIFDNVIQTPGDLVDFVEIVRGDVTPGGMGRAIKSAVNAWLNGLSEYHAIKYATGGQGYSLRDVLRLTHPKPISPKQDAIFTWLTDREKWATSDEKRALTPQIVAFEGMKKAENQETAREFIAQGKLPYEVVTGAIKPDVQTWAELMRQMPYMALLRHLNTLQRASVLSEEQFVQYAAERLSNENAMRKAKVLPFRLYSAYMMFNAATPVQKQVKEALVDALEKSFVNMPDLGGRVCISPDVSGSMGGRISQESVVRYIDIAGIFAGALLKVSKDALILPFNHAVVVASLSGRDSVMTNAEKVAKLLNGGTAVSAPISELLHKKIVVDTFIGMTDNEEWATDHYGGKGFLAVWREYKQKVAPNAKAFLVTIAPYRKAVAPKDEPDVHFIYGWSDSVLRYISMTVSGITNQVKAVRDMQI